MSNARPPAYSTPFVEVLDLFERVKNWGRWGPDDELGTLNYLDEAARLRGVAAVKDGSSISCSLEIDTSPSSNRNPVLHMLGGGDIAPAEGSSSAGDFIGLATHGPNYTHLDALCHVFFRGVMYNGRPSTLVTSRAATANSVMAAEHGIVSRGILLDVPRVKGIDFIEPEDPVRLADLEAAADAAAVRIQPGDVLLVRVGRQARLRAKGRAADQLDGRAYMAGLHPECLPWLHAMSFALLGSDGAQDVLPGPIPEVPIPVHVGTLVYMGLHLLDNAELDALAAACADRGRSDFLFILAPLRIPGATGSPVNPIAVL